MKYKIVTLSLILAFVFIGLADVSAQSQEEALTPQDPQQARMDAEEVKAQEQESLLLEKMEKESQTELARTEKLIEEMNIQLEQNNRAQPTESSPKVVAPNAPAKATTQPPVVPTQNKRKKKSSKKID